MLRMFCAGMCSILFLQFYPSTKIGKNKGIEGSTLTFFNKLPVLTALLSYRYLKPDENKKSKHKTAVKKKTLNPEFNEV